MSIDIQSISATALGIALAASCGFRVFIPMLVAGLASRFHIFNFSESFEWLASTPALIALGAATIFEIAAYYIPFVDNILDTIAAPLAAIAGTLLATSVIPIDNEWMKWMIGIVAGGGSAGLVASGTGFLRLLSSKTTLGTGNSVVATGENTAAIGGSILSFLTPILMAILFLLSFYWIIKKLIHRLNRKKENKRPEDMAI
ncbi:MAG TPA: DUF4126 domain-containing protein [Niabella sp.]|nr:DUF4126 domain-containing protein [Niabella sp.]HQW14993.1 DUF4126 domain-containing protein [Niabella sp.]HQX20115.1 DUF4126 domain-containing protein [Niabella sp.]HQX40373.1 DUF4126 domain-containing protein [Niabella sp.]HRB06720.1 DUF4126 domain-containing protein [Niabella sp.]